MRMWAVRKLLMIATHPAVGIEAWRAITREPPAA
jgi:hypothetical protein